MSEINNISETVSFEAFAIPEDQTTEILIKESKKGKTLHF